MATFGQRFDPATTFNNYHTETYGRMSQDANGNWTLVRGHGNSQRTVLDSGQIQEVLDEVNSAGIRASQGVVVPEANDMGASWQVRMNKQIDNRTREEAESAKGSVDEQVKADIRAAKADIARALVRGATAQVTEEIGGDEKTMNEHARVGSRNIHNHNMAEQISQSSAKANVEFAGAGGIDAVLGDAQETVISSDNNVYRAGGGINDLPGSGGGFRARGDWYGMGRGTYAVGMALSMMGRAFQGEFTQAQRYQEYEANFAPEAAGPDFMSTDYAAATRTNIANRAQQQAANQVWGPLQQMPYALTPSGALQRLGSVASTAGQTVLASGELSFGLGMLGSMPGMAGTALGESLMGLSTSIPGIGLAAAGGMLAWQGIDEVRNAVTGGNATIGTDLRDAFLKNPVEAYYKGRQFLGGSGAGVLMTAENSWEAMLKEENPALANYLIPTSSPKADFYKSAAESVETITGEKADTSTGAIAQLERMGTVRAGGVSVGITGAQINRLTQRQAALGLQQFGDYTGPLMQMAADRGMNPGSDAFYNYINNTNFGEDYSAFSQAQFAASRTGQYGSQLQTLFTGMGVGSALVDQMGWTRQAQVSTAAQWGGLVEQWGGTEKQAMVAAILSGGKPQSPLSGVAGAPVNNGPTLSQGQAGMIAGVASQLAPYGVSPQTVFAGMSGMSNVQMAQLGQIAGGDLQTMAYANQTGSFDFGSAWNLYTTSGVPMVQRNGQMYGQAMMGQARLGNTAAMSALGISNPNQTMQPYMMGSNFALGTKYFGNDSEMAAAFDKGGVYGADIVHTQRQLQNQLSSIGVGFAQIGAQKQYLWGQNDGGTPTNPTSGSSWGIETQQRALQIRSTRGDFAYSQQSMDLGYQYNMSSLQRSQQQWQLGYSNQMYEMNFSRQQSLLQRGWTQADWGYEDQTRNLNYGWSMQDYQLQIRQASGLQRMQLIRERDRATTSHNLETGQIDRTRSRQEETWKLEDEHYDKQKKYITDNAALTLKNYEAEKAHATEMYNLEQANLKRQKSGFEESTKLQQQAIDLQRNYQVQQIGFQEQSLGIQAKAAIDAANYKIAMDGVSKDWTDILGYVQQTPQMTVDTIKGMLEAQAKVPVGVPKAITDLVSSLGSDKVALNSNAVADVIRALASIDANKLKALAPLLYLLQ
jgi:hypothetical protein